MDSRSNPGDAGDGLTLIAYTAEPGTRPADAFALLASWAATEDGGGLSADDAADQTDRAR